MIDTWTIRSCFTFFPVGYKSLRRPQGGKKQDPKYLRSCRQRANSANKHRDRNHRKHRNLEQYKLFPLGYAPISCMYATSTVLPQPAKRRSCDFSLAWHGKYKKMRFFVREKRNNYARPPGWRSGTPSLMQLQNCLVNSKAHSFRAFRVFFCPTSGLFARSKQTGRVFPSGENPFKNHSSGLCSIDVALPQKRKKDQTV